MEKNRVEELLKADREGRLLVLPAKMGTPIYVVVCKSKRFFNHQTEKWFSYVNKTSIKPSNAFRVLEEYGKIYFLDKEEAQRVSDVLNEDAIAGRFKKESIWRDS